MDYDPSARIGCTFRLICFKLMDMYFLPFLCASSHEQKVVRVGFLGFGSLSFSPAPWFYRGSDCCDSSSQPLLEEILDKMCLMSMRSKTRKCLDTCEYYSHSSKHSGHEFAGGSELSSSSSLSTINDRAEALEVSRHPPKPALGTRHQF